MRVGFTGTRAGMTAAQQTMVYRVLLYLAATDLDHGDCLGADDQADQIGRELGLTIYIHPPDNPKLRAWCNTRPIGETWTEIPEQPYRARNRAIVDSAQVMIGAPKEMAEIVHSGTWSTIRYAVQRAKPVWVAMPDGTIQQR